MSSSQGLQDDFLLIQFLDEYDQGFASTLDSIGSRPRNRIGAVGSGEMQRLLDHNRGNYKHIVVDRSSRVI
jgi:hypothetical protein